MTKFFVATLIALSTTAAFAQDDAKMDQPAQDATHKSQTVETKTTTTKKSSKKMDAKKANKDNQPSTTGSDMNTTTDQTK